MKGIESRRKRVEKVSESERNLAEKVERIEEAGERWREQRGSMEFGRKKEGFLYLIIPFSGGVIIKY